MPGVRKAEVDFNKKEAYVTADKQSLDIPAMLKALQKVEYTGSVKSGPN